MRRALTLLLLRGPEVTAGQFPLSHVFFDEKGGGDTQKSHGAKSGLSRGWARTWMFCSLSEVTVSLVLLDLVSFGILFFFFFF